MSKNLLHSYFNDDELFLISQKIKENEKTTSGELCVRIKEKRDFLKRKTPIFDLAKNEFYRLRIDKTRDKTGILILILLESHEFYILADEGINSKVEQSTWNNISAAMSNYFKETKYCNGVVFAVEEIGKILSEHFPVKPDDTNEISNQVII